MRAGARVVRGRQRVDQDWKLLAAAVNLARLAALGLDFTDGSPVAGGRESLSCSAFAGF